MSNEPNEKIGQRAVEGKTRLNSITEYQQRRLEQIDSGIWNQPWTTPKTIQLFGHYAIVFNEKRDVFDQRDRCVRFSIRVQNSFADTFSDHEVKVSDGKIRSVRAGGFISDGRHQEIVELRKAFVYQHTAHRVTQLADAAHTHIENANRGDHEICLMGILDYLEEGGESPCVPVRAESIVQHTELVKEIAKRALIYPHESYKDGGSIWVPDDDVFPIMTQSRAYELHEGQFNYFPGEILKMFVAGSVFRNVLATAVIIGKNEIKTRSSVSMAGCDSMESMGMMFLEYLRKN